MVILTAASFPDTLSLGLALTKFEHHEGGQDNHGDLLIGALSARTDIESILVIYVFPSCEQISL